MTVILRGFRRRDLTRPAGQAGGAGGVYLAAVTNLIALIGGACSRSEQPTVLPVKLVVRASTVPLMGNTIAPSPGAGKVPGPAGAR